MACQLRCEYYELTPIDYRESGDPRDANRSLDLANNVWLSGVWLGKFLRNLVATTIYLCALEKARKRHF